MVRKFPLRLQWRLHLGLQLTCALNPHQGERDRQTEAERDSQKEASGRVSSRCFYNTKPNCQEVPATHTLRHNSLLLCGYVCHGIFSAFLLSHRRLVTFFHNDLLMTHIDLRQKKTLTTSPLVTFYLLFSCTVPLSEA